MSRESGAIHMAEGILLYPTVDVDLDLNYEIQGHRVRVKTINLNQDWQNIRRDLLQVVDVVVQ